MSTTLTVRVDEALRDALERRARAQGRTLSDVSREILREALEERPLGLDTGHLRGRLELGQKEGEAWKRELRQRNWRS